MTVNVIAILKTFLETKKIVDNTLDVDGIMQRATQSSPDGVRLCDNIHSIMGSTELAREFLESAKHSRTCSC